MFPERIETDRLLLERLSRDRVTVDELYDLFASGEADRVFEHLPRSPYETPQEPADALEKAEERWESGDRAEYAVRERENGRLVGTAALMPDWERRTAWLGLLLHPSAWGEGYSGERAEAMLELAFETLDLELVAVSHGEGNGKSRRAVEKYVERFGGSRDALLRNWYPTDDGTSDEVRYTVARAAYLDATG